MVRRVVLLAFPLILSNLTQPLLASVDTILSGHLPSSTALGGVAMGGLSFNAIFRSFGFLRMGTTGPVAQAHGAGDEDALAVHVVRGFVLALGLGLAAVLLRVPLIAIAADVRRSRLSRPQRADASDQRARLLACSGMPAEKNTMLQRLRIPILHWTNKSL
jgi:hypothetical protein